MTESIGSARLDRRGLLRGSLATAALAGLGGTLAGCATSGGGQVKQETGTKSADNPFGVPDGSTIDAVIFNGGYGYDYVQFAADQLKKKLPKVTPKVTPSTQIAQELQPRFAGGDPPDLIDNSGAGAMTFNSIQDQLEDLRDVFDANNYEGTKISDTLYPGAIEAGTFGGKVLEVNYVLSLYAIWYSASLFKENGWSVPQTWDEVIDLGAKAKAKGKYLWVWGKEAATYYQTLAMESATKAAGDDFRLPLENLKPKSWSHPAIQNVFKALETCVQKGYFKPGGAGTQFTKAQAQWSNDQAAILYPSGAWIENEMKDQTKEGFEMTGAPVPVASTSGEAMPYNAIYSTAGEPFIVPKGKNPAGGKELLRAMLSKEASANFAKTKLAPTIVKGGIPDDAFGSTALASQVKMLNDAGSNTFRFTTIGIYGMNTDQLVVWNNFLSGKIDAKGLTEGLQKIMDKVADDPSVKKTKAT
ncbi:N-acetylglucosamine/diacetylchitobiose ABC transporter substrate-binding protein [Microlunatus sp. Gsoil 973]|uniref:N-acetylglucosamine/diacetylchitobiose ABC transporter substrate-binding protein n=1 Tax=Microlunatus sp. Gsoil 973 TaxID=2672569 RepID=UPI0012B4C092|nr:N-acetylglucosamine/diacetylchitobiose ABC transporter substrate-binding protein [Microlunatus sp. Gsoil 973]QGN34197.1 carbohydrate ABC transporter, N-acetylglucosamine/diacetylchitobiose-binding protein [Microlunatus sp. Gsoil 973]